MFNLLPSTNFRKTLRDMDSVFDELDEMFKIERHSRISPTREYLVKDEKDHLSLELAVPGHSNKTVDVTFETFHLIITAKPGEDSSTLAKDHYFKFKVPVQIEADSISAQVENGILKITLVKKKENQANSVKIKVK